MLDTTSLYDEFSQDYDRFVNWDGRLALEMPFLLARLHEHQARRILDVACGTGQHAIALAKVGFEAAATDLSAAMVARAQENATRAGAEVQVWRAGFGELAARSVERGESPFDAITCLGNSLPHLLTPAQLRDAFADMSAVLRPGGILIAQMRNFDRVLTQRQRFMTPEEHRSASGEWVFFRFYDLSDTADGGTRLQFNVVRLHRQADGAWTPQVGRTALRAWQQREVVTALSAAGYTEIALYGSLGGETFDAAESGDLVVVAQTRDARQRREPGCSASR